MKFLIISLFILASCRTSSFSGRTPSSGGGGNQTTGESTGESTGGTTTSTGTGTATGGNTSATGSGTGGVTTGSTSGGGTDGGWSGAIEFGSLTPKWHVGDDNFDNSTCKLGVGVRVFRGPKAYFCFETRANSLPVKIILSHCGVDNSKGWISHAFLQGQFNDFSNPYSSSTPFTLVENRVFKNFVTKQTLPSVVTLGSAGKYQIAIVSGKERGTSNPDLDDFNIKAKITTTGGANLLKGEVQSNPCF